MNKDISWLKNNMFAHRGLHNEYYPENSISSFINAIKYEYYIELDVQLTKDKKVIVFHDYDLERMTGVDKSVDELTYKEIRELTLLDTNEKIPLLEEVLYIVDNKVPIIIDMKTKIDYIDLSEIVYNISKKYTGKYAIQSFDPRVIKWYNDNANEVVIGKVSYNLIYKIMKIYKEKISHTRSLGIRYNYDYIAASFIGINSVNIFLKRRKMPVLCWTIKDKEQIKKALKYADSIIFEGFRSINISKRS